MSAGLNSPHWYRVARLCPKLHDQVQVHRHDYRGLIWYLLENTTTGRSHRFNPAAYQFIGLMDGERSVQEIYQHITEKLDEYAPGQEEIIDLMGKLYQADLLKSGAFADTEELFERQSQQKSRRFRQRFANPVALRFALWDPEDFLNRHFHKLGWIFSKWAGLVWLLAMVYTILQAVQHWPQIEHHFGINALSPYNLLLMFLLYPPIKFIHELGHAFSAKLEGGEVHEMGVNFLLFMPVPYVNVSTATHFRNPYKRILVSAAGILVESFLAALGLLLFLAAQPGIVQSIGFNIFLIGGVSSLFFNGNPLLKYDAYYVLADALGIPNLFQRSAQYWQYLFQRYLFGLRDAISPANAPGEAPWFVVYSLLSLGYRLGILWFILGVVTEKFFYLGILLAAWLIGMQILMPLYRALRYLVASPALGRNRNRALVSSLTIASLLIAFVGFTPIPAYTLNEGVVWQPEEVRLLAEHDGFVRALEVENNQRVEAGTPLISLQDPFLQSEARIAQARVGELQSRYRASRARSHIEAGIVREELQVAESELEFIREKNTTMSVNAFKDGRLILPQASDLPGRFVRKGELLGYILDDETPTVRMAVSQDHIGQLRQRVVEISVRFASLPAREFPAAILRQAPEATNRLPSAALATTGGGKFIVTPGNDDEPVTSEKVFLVDLQPDFGGARIPFGTRAYVRVDHGAEPLAIQWYRRIRQVFLRQFSV
ncbi:MAG: efflux RND transporter periplasmic adaptor subunit [Gammaproteobacteria bacterium]|nr:efflux RND transporter periplasmic adaptor subunit [Gammaproteobacteria bacterium]MDH3448445.1 efflux RND transporter periplasmic adaptor subunit [Gammaproteobacteria bacterium]